MTESKQRSTAVDSTAAPMTPSSTSSQVKKARVVKIAAVKGKQAEMKKEEPKLMKKTRSRAKKLAESYKQLKKEKSKPSASNTKTQSSVKFKRPACLLQPTVSYTCYLCQNCWNDTRFGPVEKIGDKLLMAISMCDACVGLNAQYRSLYFGGTA